MRYDGPVEIDAGGILLDGPVDSACRVAVIQRITPADWSLPKGHLESGESLEEAARREVFEETGYAATCMGIAGAIAYIHDGRAKSATFFYFRRDSDLPEQDDLDGVGSVEWLTFDEARARVTYSELSDLLARAQGGVGVPQEDSTLSHGPRRRTLSRRLSTRDDRLHLALESYARELTGLRRRPRTPGGTSETTWWRPAADSLLELARALRGRGDIDSAWDALNASKRLSLYELSQAELTSRAEVLKAEIESKLRGWRKAAACDALLADEASYGPVEVACAQRMLDEESTNKYIKLKIAGRRLLLAAVLLALTIIGLWVATGLGWFAGIAIDSGSTFVLHDGGLFGGVLLLGIFGAMLSLALDLSHSSATQSRIYDLTTTQIAAPVARISIGAGSAVLTVSAAQAALVGGGTPWLYLAAIPAGFSERLVRKSVENLETATTGTE